MLLIRYYYLKYLNILLLENAISLEVEDNRGKTVSKFRYGLFLARISLLSIILTLAFFIRFFAKKFLLSIMTECYEELILLISKWKDFREVQIDGDIKNFADWILHENKFVATLSDQEDFIVAQVEKMEEKNTIPDLANRGVIGHLLARMNLFVKNYAKQPFQEIGLNSLEEFRLLQMIDRVKNINKSELSNQSLMEFSTVVDILKRFTKKGLIKQVTDPNDQRASMLQITIKGKSLLLKTYKTLAALKPNVAGDLTVKEQEILINLLLKLNNFHTDYFEGHFINKKRKP